MAETKKAPKRSKKKTSGQKLIRILLICVIVLAVTVLAAGGYMIYQVLGGGDTRPDADLKVFDRTPDSMNGKVAYYVIGLRGIDASKPFDALSLLCYDKAAKKVDVLQIPVATYIGTGHTATAVGDIWSHPTPITWCDTCRKSVADAEAKNCPDCGTAVTTRTGSASGELMRFFNEQLSMPVDQYFIMEHKTLSQLVDLMGGVDVVIEKAMTVGEINYPAGRQTLSGDAVLEYVAGFGYKGTPASDVERMLRCRKVFAAVFTKLVSADKEKTHEYFYGTDTAYGVQNGQYPFVTNNANAEQDIDQMVALCDALGRVSVGNMTFSLLPGASAKQGKDEYFSLYRTATANLLQARFNPYGEPVEETDLALTELVSGKEGDTKTAGFYEYLPNQEG